MDSAALKTYLAERAARIDRALVEAMPAPTTFPERLHRAMLYSLTAPGKRIRPILCLAAAAASGGREEDAVAPACAVEMIHAHSLIHDDLPCMDDDDLRRGLPTCHVRFGEVTALLAGDALISAAYAVLARAPLADETVRRLVAALAAAAGSEGICGGQEADMAAEGTEAGLEAVETIHRYKTGSLLRAAVVMGGIAGGALTAVATDFTRSVLYVPA
ncbi:MAG TPA: polyprenyl synthetase family protein [bacterium]|nr:polyprenyl synthetase family protein [bacterium]